MGSQNKGIILNFVNLFLLNSSNIEDCLLGIESNSSSLIVWSSIFNNNQSSIEMESDGLPLSIRRSVFKNGVNGVNSESSSISITDGTKFENLEHGVLISNTQNLMARINSITFNNVDYPVESKQCIPNTNYEIKNCSFDDYIIWYFRSTYANSIIYWLDN